MWSGLPFFDFASGARALLQPSKRVARRAVWDRWKTINALLLGIQVKTPLALADLWLAANSFRRSTCADNDFSSCEICAPTHVSNRADHWHEYSVKVRSRGLPLVKHES